MSRNFRQLLEDRWSEGKFVCVGLDSDLERIPGARVGGVMEVVLGFNRRVVEATKDLVCAYKPNAAFYEEHGDTGWLTLRETVLYIKKVAPGVPVILDAKRTDIGKTNVKYAASIFGFLEADAVTVNPYFGGESLQPFLDYKDKGIIILCRTSNPGAGEFQDLKVPRDTPLSNGALNPPLYQIVAERVASSWNKHGNCGLVVGATYPAELKEVRDLVGDMPILMPGIGTQDGDLEAAVSAGKDSRGRGMIINSSSGIIFPRVGDPRMETQKLHDAITMQLTPMVEL